MKIKLSKKESKVFRICMEEFIIKPFFASGVIFVTVILTLIPITDWGLTKESGLLSLFPLGIFLYWYWICFKQDFTKEEAK